MFESHVDPRAILIWVGNAATGAMVISGPELLPRAMSGFTFLLQLGSVMMSMVYITIGGHRKHVY